MKIPQPYFEKIFSYGTLSVEEVLLEDVYPVLFVLKNQTEQRFICVCCEIREEQRWIINPISDSDLIEFLDNKRTARDIFTHGASQMVAVRSYATRKETFTQVGDGQLDVRDLPREGVYLDAEDGDFAEYKQRLQASCAAEESWRYIDTFCEICWTHTAVFTSENTVRTPSGRGSRGLLKFQPAQTFRGVAHYA